MKLIIIFGPQAVGKMTVGQELEKITDLKLFYNHMTMDAISSFFPIESATNARLKTLFRLEIFKEIAKSNLKGVVFTYVWKLEKKHNEKFIKKVVDIFEGVGGDVYFIELEANQKERMRRNKTANRLRNKPSKRNIALSEKSLLEFDKFYEMNTKQGGRFKNKNYLKIDNTNLRPKEVAEKIVKYFEL